MRGVPMVISQDQKNSTKSTRGILHHEDFTNNIFTQSWRPADDRRPLSGLVAMIHGYASESGWLFELTAVAVAKQGFLAVALDLPGHGRSHGPRTHLPSLDPVVSTCIQVFDRSRKTDPNLPAFLYGESLGGAVAMLIALRQKQGGIWAGLVLNGAMCGVSRKIKPTWPVEEFLFVPALLVPKWRATLFTNSLVEKSYKEKWKRNLARGCERTRPVDEHPTFGTSWELLRVVREVERRCWELEIPVLILHGREDSVCDSESAELVYELVGSKDKSLEILEGMWHQLIGESEETVEIGFAAVFSWLKERAHKAVVAAEGTRVAI